MARRRIGSGSGEPARVSSAVRVARSTIRISSWAKAAPTHRRMPPPKGSQAYVSTGPSRNRSGRKACGSG